MPVTSPRYRSAWGEDVDNLPAEVSRAEEPIRVPAAGRSVETQPLSLKQGQAGVSSPAQSEPTPLSGTSFSAALAAALTPYGPPHSKWGVLAKRIGVHASLLRRMRLGQGGVTAKTMDKIAERLGWTVTIHSRGE